MKKIIPYLLLNFFISALAMLLVLLVWNRVHKPAQVLIQSPATQPVAATQLKPVVSDPARGNTQVEILAVIGRGDLEFEVVQIINNGDTPIDLNGWSLSSGSERFNFPVVVLFPGGSLNVYSKTGTNNSIELFWGRETPAWQAGDYIDLKDAAGVTMATFQVL